MIHLDELNASGRARFVEVLGAVFEDSPWVAEHAWEVRPFPTVTALHQAMFDEVIDAEEEEQLEFLNGHPDLAGSAVLGEHSASEQSGLGLDALDDDAAARFEAMNDAYRTRFGFPFIICVRRHTRASIAREFERRMSAEPAAERAAALEEIFRLTRLRIAGLVSGPGMPVTGGGLSTHVLDTVQGRPAEGVAVELFVLEPDGPELLVRSTTNADGRVSGGLIPDGEPLRIGQYEIRFHVGEYFARTGLPVADPPFLDVVPLRFGLAEAEMHYHVPLLVSPWTYTTYRGS